MIVRHLHTWVYFQFLQIIIKYYFSSSVGIYEKLDYIKGIGIETVWIQPFYKSPMADFGYDVSDFREIEPMFGTMQDFKKLIAGIHERGKNDFYTSLALEFFEQKGLKL